MDLSCEASVIIILQLTSHWSVLVSSLNLPSNLAELAGIENLPSDVVFTDANSIKSQYLGGNITAGQTLDILNVLIDSVYKSTPDKEHSPFTCEFDGLAALTCGKKPRGVRSDGEPIRSATLAGIFVDALWATGGKPLTLTEMKEWYTIKDFDHMKALGLNTVQMLVPTAAFVPGDKFGARVSTLMEDMMADISSVGLDIIIALVGTGDELDAVVAAAKYFSSKQSVIAMTLPSQTNLDVKSMIDAIHVQAPTLPLFVPMGLGDLIKYDGEFDTNVYGSLDMSHTGAVADIASSDSQEDRSKMFYHEAVSCMARSPLEFGDCFQKLPIFVSTGFDLSIDDCVNKGISPSFKDYGQCDRFDETINSQWWFRHRASFAARQLYAYERGLGWSFAAWKVYGADETGDIDSPDKLMSLKDVAKAGLFPDLKTGIPAKKACLNPPENDFILGDATLSPTAGPPPDCGNGWWNYTIGNCSYWIPPPPPTASPTMACPICDDCITDTSAMLVPSDYQLFGGGIVLGAILGVLVAKFGLSNKRNDYQTIPTN